MSNRWPHPTRRGPALGSPRAAPTGQRVMRGEPPSHAARRACPCGRLCGRCPRRHPAIPGASPSPVDEVHVSGPRRRPSPEGTLHRRVPSEDEPRTCAGPGPHARRAAAGGTGCRQRRPRDAGPRDPGRVGRAHGAPGAHATRVHPDTRLVLRTRPGATEGQLLGGPSCAQATAAAPSRTSSACARPCATGRQGRVSSRSVPVPDACGRRPRRGIVDRSTMLRGMYVTRHHSVRCRTLNACEVPNADRNLHRR